MKIQRTAAVLAAFLAAGMLADICPAEMRLQISVFPVVDIYNRALGSEQTLHADGEAEQAVEKIFNAIKPERPALPSISLPIRPTDFEFLEQWLYETGLSARYFVDRIPAGGKLDRAALEEMRVPITHPSSSSFSVGETYLVKIRKTDYHSDSVAFEVTVGQNDRRVFRFSRPHIHLTPLNYRSSGLIIETADLQLSRSEEDRLREDIGRGLEGRHHELVWFRQYRTLDDLLECIRQRQPISPTAQTSYNSCGEKNLFYLIRIGPGNSEG